MRLLCLLCSWVLAVLAGGVGVTPYEVLGVAPSASQLEVRKAYRQLALKHHPDKDPGGIGRFLEIAKAYEVSPRLVPACAVRTLRSARWARRPVKTCITVEGVVRQQ